MPKFLLIIFLLPLALRAQHVVTTDLDNFWQALDSVRSQKDSVTQREIVRRLYLDNASEGLQAFLRNKEGLDQQLANLIIGDPLFWDSIRIKSQKLKAIIPGIEEGIQKCQSLYPAL
jgi:hypothetical protein